MQFTPMTEQQIEKLRGFTLLPEGFYAFEVIEANEGNSQNGKPYMMLKLKLTDQFGKTRYINDFLRPSYESKLYRFFSVANLTENYSKGILLPSDCLGVSGKVKIIQIPHFQDATKIINEVKGYYPADEKIDDLKKETSAQIIDDEIPF